MSEWEEEEKKGRKRRKGNIVKEKEVGCESWWRAMEHNRHKSGGSGLQAAGSIGHERWGSSKFLCDSAFPH